MSSFALGDAFIDVGVNKQNLKNELADAKDTATSAFAGIGKALTGAMAGALVAAGGFIATSLAIRECVSAAMEAQVEENELMQALQSTGQAVDENFERFNSLGDAFERHTQVSGGVVLGLAKTATNLGLVGDQAEQAIKASIGLAKAFGMDQEAALNDLNKSLKGYRSGLDNIVPGLKEATTEQERMAAISAAANAGLLQQAGAAGTMQGQWDILSNAFGKFGETLGKLLTGGDGLSGFFGMLTTITETMTTMVEGVISWKEAQIEAWTSATEQTGTWANYLSEVWADVQSGFDMAVFAVLNLGTTFDVLKETAVNNWNFIVAKIEWFGTIMGETGAWIYNNWNDIWTDIGNLIVTVTSNAIENIKNFFSNLWEYLKSGGTKGFEEAFAKPLTEGFERVSKKLELSDFVAPEMNTEAAEKFMDEYKKYTSERDKKTSEEKNRITSPVNLTSLAAPEAVEEKKAEEKAAEKGTSDAGGFGDLVGQWKKAQTDVLKQEDALQKEANRIAKEANQKMDQHTMLLTKIAASSGLA